MGYPEGSYGGRVCSFRVFVCGSLSQVGEVIDALCGTNLIYHLNIQEQMLDKTVDEHEASDQNTVLTSNNDDSVDNEHHTNSPNSSPFKQACPFTIYDFLQ